MKRFFADSMLGRLALWMRVAGFDVEYENAIDDAELVKRARESGRTILTRDTLLARRRWVRDNHLFIENDHYGKQLEQVISVYGYEGDRFLTICLRCNVALETIEKGLVRDRVPSYVYSTHESFSTCPICRRIYWGGTHREEMKRELEEILKASHKAKIKQLTGERDEST